MSSASMISNLILRWRILFLLFFAATTSYAEPVTTGLAASGAILSTLHSILDTTAEVSQTVSAFSELYSEMNADGEISEEGQKFIQEIQEVESIARDVGYTHEQTEDLLKTDRDGAQKLVYVLKKMTQAIRTAKSATRLIQRIATKAQIAQIEAAETEKEILKVQYKILLEARRKSLLEKKEKLKEALEKKHYLDQKEKEIEARGGLGLGKIGIYSFPKLSSQFKEAIDLSKKLQKKLIFLILPIFMAGVAFNSLKLSSADKIWKLIQNVLLCFFWFMITPQLIQWILEVSQALSREFVAHELVKKSVLHPPDPTAWINLFNAFSWVYSNFKIICFELADFSFNLILSLLILFFPAVIFMMKIVGNDRDFFPFLAGFIALSLWPLFWNLTGLFTHQLFQSESLFSAANIASVACAFFQLVSPYFAYKILQGSGGIEAISGVAGKMAGGVGMALGSKRTSEGASSIATGVGKGISYLGTQFGQRAVAAQRRLSEERKNPGSTVSSQAVQGMRGLISNHGTARSQGNNSPSSSTHSRNSSGSTSSANFRSESGLQTSEQSSTARILSGLKAARRIRPSPGIRPTDRSKK